MGIQNRFFTFRHTNKNFIKLRSLPQVQHGPPTSRCSIWRHWYLAKAINYKILHLKLSSDPLKLGTKGFDSNLLSGSQEPETPSFWEMTASLANKISTFREKKKTRFHSFRGKNKCLDIPTPVDEVTILLRNVGIRIPSDVHAHPKRTTLAVQRYIISRTRASKLE